MKLKPVSNSAGELYGYAHWCPGCECAHVFHVIKSSEGSPCWTFDGDMERPTFTPSMRYFEHERKDANGAVLRPEKTLCHYLLREGEIDFLADSSDHELRGKVPLPELPADYQV